MLATAGVVAVALLAGPGAAPAPSTDEIRVGQPVPPIAGTTLDGTSFDLAALRGRPVVVNFWGPSCIPCRDEFPLMIDRLAANADAGLEIVGVLYLDDETSARKFVAEYGGSWPTVVDPGWAIAKSYRVAARPQTYFVDRSGILRSIQVGGLTGPDFDRQLAAILGP